MIVFTPLFHSSRTPGELDATLPRLRRFEKRRRLAALPVTLVLPLQRSFPLVADRAPRRDVAADTYRISSSPRSASPDVRSRGI